jgi:hypothetical protein
VNSFLSANLKIDYRHQEESAQESHHLDHTLNFDESLSNSENLQMQGIETLEGQKGNIFCCSITKLQHLRALLYVTS